MCTRYTNTLTWEQLVEYFGIANTDFRPELRRNYNVSPSQTVPVIRRGSNGRELTMMRWGFKTPGSNQAFVNATAEKVATSKPFHAAFATRRCLVPADGFFEWKTGSDGRRQPYRITLAGEQPLAFAGLWESWEGEMGNRQERFETFCIITTAANDMMRPIHHRMPAILDPETYDGWLNGLGGRELLVPFPSDAMTAYKVSIRVNDAHHNDIECVTPVY